MYIFSSSNFNHCPAPNTNTRCESSHFLQKHACLTKLIYRIEWCIIYTLLKEKTAFYLYFGFLSSPESRFSWKQSALVFCSLFWRSDRFFVSRAFKPIPIRDSPCYNMLGLEWPFCIYWTEVNPPNVLMYKPLGFFISTITLVLLCRSQNRFCFHWTIPQCKKKNPDPMTVSTHFENRRSISFCSHLLICLMYSKYILSIRRSGTYKFNSEQMREKWTYTLSGQNIDKQISQCHHSFRMCLDCFHIWKKP